MPQITTEQLVKSLKTEQAYLAGAWGNVQAASRKYAMMKAFGVYEENGRTVRPSFSDVESLLEFYHRELLEAVMFAYREDASFGKSVCEALQS